MARRARKRTRQFGSTSVNQPRAGTAVSPYLPGDLLPVNLAQLAADVRRRSSFVWIRVERCDHQRRIVFGAIESEASGPDRALSHGAKLAVSYDLVLKNSSVLRTGKHLPG